MDSKLKEKWLSALRGGTHKRDERGQHLHLGDRFNVIGVLLDVSGTSWETTDGLAYCSEPARFASVSPSRLQSLGLSEHHYRKLFELSDNRATFAEMADYIEREVN